MQKPFILKTNLVEGVEQLQVGSRHHLLPLQLLVNLAFLLRLLSHVRLRRSVVVAQVDDLLFLSKGITLFLTLLRANKDLSRLMVKMRLFKFRVYLITHIIYVNQKTSNIRLKFDNTNVLRFL